MIYLINKNDINKKVVIFTFFKVSGGFMTMSNNKETAFETANLFFERVLFDDFEVSYSKDDYFFGKYYDTLFREGTATEVSEKENKACEVFRDILYSNLGEKLSPVSFEDIATTTYLHEEDIIALSPRVEAFLKFLKNSSIDHALFMNYMRADGLRLVYQKSDYIHFLNKACQVFDYRMITYNNGRDYAVFKLPKETWEGIVRVEFRKEYLAWEAVFKILEHSKNYYFEDFTCDIDLEDLKKLKQYFLYKTVCKINKAKNERRILILNKLIFEY